MTVLDERYHRQELMDWWDQGKVSSARMLVIGAGALGNEILKNLALIGVGRVLVYDMDLIEKSNLSRSVLFRDSDVGKAKALVAAERMAELNPDCRCVGVIGNVMHKAGLGAFLWSDVVISGVDNREARVFINSAASRTGKVWIDGAIEGLSGVVRAFDPGSGACYECTMNETDRKMLAERRSCALLAREVRSQGRVPNSAITASIIGALQVQEAMKLLHDQPDTRGQGMHIDGLWNQISQVKYQRKPDCYGHERCEAIDAIDGRSEKTTLHEILEMAEERYGEGAELDLSRDVIVRLSCPGCDSTTPGGAVLGEMTELKARCPQCGTHRLIEIASSVRRDGEIDLSLTPERLGLPPYDIIVARKGVEDSQAWLLSGDVDRVLGSLA